MYSAYINNMFHLNQPQDFGFGTLLAVPIEENQPPCDSNAKKQAGSFCSILHSSDMIYIYIYYTHLFNMIQYDNIYIYIISIQNIHHMYIYIHNMY